MDVQYYIVSPLFVWLLSRYVQIFLSIKIVWIYCALYLTTKTHL